VDALDKKIEEYFWACDLLRMEGRTAEALLLDEAGLRALGANEDGAIVAHLTRAPLAPLSQSGALSLDTVANPVYRDRFAELREKVLARALRGGSLSVDKAALGPPAPRELTRESWRRVKAVFDGWRAWQGERPPENFEALGDARVRELLDGPVLGKLSEAIAVDKAAAEGLEQVAELEKLILLQRWLVDLTNNFVNFSSIYRPDATALVEMGSLVIDGRRLDFCLRVDDRGGHKKVAAESLIFLAYVSVSAKDGSAPAFEVVAPVTAGERGRLRVGKRGLFIDLEGKEWDAQVAEILENPISVKEAMFAPFRRVSLFMSKKIEDWFGAQEAAREKKITAGMEQEFTEAGKRADQAEAELAAPRPAATGAPSAHGGKGLDVNSLILGGGIALGGLATVFGAVFGLLASLKGWAAVGGVVIAVMMLSALIGWLKLRRRDMSLILEASGWALNVNMKVNRRIGGLFTFTPELPAGSTRDHLDVLAPNEHRHRGWILFGLALVVAVAAGFAVWRFMLHGVLALPAWLKRT
jgi:hypothetical protein